MIKKILTLTKFNDHIIASLNNKLRHDTKFSSCINFIINIAYKIRIKLKGMSETSIAIEEKIKFEHRSFEFKNKKLFPNVVLIVAELSIPQCKKYRVNQKVSMLKYLDKKVEVASWTDKVRVINLMQTSGVVIFYRVPGYDMVKSYFELAKYLGVVTYFDVDDLIFDKAMLKENKSLKHLSKKDLDGVFKGADLYYESMMLADYGIASTEELASQMHNKTNRPVYVLNNAIDADSLGIKPPIKPNSNRIRIVYGSGTNTHDEDFVVAAGALLNVLKDFDSVDFIIYGHLKLDDKFLPFKDRVFRVPFVDAQDYYRALGGCDIGMSPLDPTRFNDCKSNIKFLESAIYHVPIVCSDVAEFRKIIINGKNGFLVNNSEEWYQAFKKLIQDFDLRRGIANCAYKDVINSYNWKTIARNQFELLLPYPVKKKKRIISVNILFKPVSFGGATILMENLVKEIQNKDFEFMVFCGTMDQHLPHGHAERYEIDGINVVITRVDSLLELKNPKTQGVFNDLIIGYQPDLVHFHSIQYLGAGLADACFMHKIPYLITLHDAWWFCERQFMINKENKYCGNEEGLLSICASCVSDSSFNHKRRFELFDVCEKAEWLLAPSDFQRDLYISAGFSAEKLIVNKNGVLPVKNKLDILDKNRKITFAYLGGKAIHKGYFWLNGIFSDMCGEFNLKLVSLESRMGSALDYKKDLKLVDLSKVEIVPCFNQENIDQFFSQIDVILFPSECKESFGLTVREAMLRDVWVVSTDCGGPIEDIVEGINGNITPFGDQKKFKEIVQVIIDNAEKYKSYKNPLKDKITLIKAQSDELHQIYSQILK